MSPIPRAGQSVEYQNFDNFTQMNENVNHPNSLEIKNNKFRVILHS